MTTTSEGFLNSFVNLVTWTSLNRIWRAKYIARSIIFSLVLSVCSSIITWLWTILESSGFDWVVYLLLWLPLVFFFIYWSVYLNNKRFHDRWTSWWWQLLLLIPVVNLVVTLYLWLAKGDEWVNEYGESSETKTWEKVLAWILPILFVFVIVWVLAAALLPRMQSAQNRARDVARKSDLSQIQTAIIASQIESWKWPGMNNASNWISVSDIETELLKAGLSSAPKDPLSSNKSTWLGTVEAKWNYLYLVAKRNGISNGWFVLMAKTETEAWSNWVVCENKSWLENWYITRDTDLRDVKPCNMVSKWNSCSATNCTYNSTDQLRYILMY